MKIKELVYVDPPLVKNINQETLCLVIIMTLVWTATDIDLNNTNEDSRIHSHMH